MKTQNQHSRHRLIAVVLTFALIVLGLAAFSPPRAFAIGDTPEPTPQIIVPPPPPSSCQYDQDTTTNVPLTGLGPKLDIYRATEKTTYAGFCGIACPSASYSWQDPLGTYCDCYYDTIPQLRDAGVETWEMHRTRYAIWSNPNNPRNLLIALAGQNGVSSGGSSGGGGPGNTTGQPNKWLDKCNDLNCGEQTFSDASFVGRLLDAPGLNITQENTFAVAFLDHQYDWNSPYRAQIRQGLFQWLKTKVSPTSLKQIIITGHSRGGCLTLGLIKEFREDPAFNAVKILGAPVDGTCSDGENGTSAWFNDTDNPLPDAPWDWHAWNSSFSTVNNQKVCIQNTVGGEPQGLIAGVHAFFLTKWHNSWMNIPHIMSGSCVGNSIASLSDGVCIPGDAFSTALFHVKSDVVDRALRFVESNVVHVLSLTPSSLVNGVVGSTYSQALALTDTEAVYTPPLPQTFTLAGGSLPPGLTLSATGVLSGTPTTGGTFAFTVDGGDANGFTATQNYTLTINSPSDTTPPVITPSVNGTLGNNGWYMSNVSVSWSVVDNESTVTMQVGCDPQTVSTDSAGITFTCQATSAGGTASQSVTIKRDATAPVLSPTVSPNPVLLNGTATASPGASDATSGLAAASCGTVSTTTVGNFTVACTATDNAGNGASASAGYRVTYQFLGFFQPVDNLPTFNSVKAGQGLPVNFSLGGNYGLNILAAGSPTSQQIACPRGGLFDDIEQVVTASSSGLQYDATTATYTYVWKTQKVWVGTCRQFTLTLSDGTSHTANFQFK